MIDYLRASFPPNRLVALATPFAVTGAAAFANWIQDVVGADLDEGALTAFLISVVTATIAAIYKWLDGWQKHEKYDYMLAAEVVEHSLAHDHPPGENELIAAFPEERAVEPDMPEGAVGGKPGEGLGA